MIPCHRIESAVTYLIQKYNVTLEKASQPRHPTGASPFPSSASPAPLSGRIARYGCALQYGTAHAVSRSQCSLAGLLLAADSV